MISEIEKVTYMHFRVPVLNSGAKEGKPAWFYRYCRRISPWKPDTRGGKTVCVIKLKDGRECIGEALCSMADNFCYRTGRELAYERAAEQLSMVMTWSFPERNAMVITSALQLRDNNPDDGNASSSMKLSSLGTSLEVQIVFDFENDLLPVDRSTVIESAVEKILFLDPWLGLTNPLLAIRVFSDGQEVYKKTIQDDLFGEQGDG